VLLLPLELLQVGAHALQVMEQLGCYAWNVKTMLGWISCSGVGAIHAGGWSYTRYSHERKF
jgi:hypothetical protein